MGTRSSIDGGLPGGHRDGGLLARKQGPVVDGGSRGEDAVKAIL